MRPPRDWTGHELANSLCRIGYVIDHQMGSHIRLTYSAGGIHHVTVPANSALKAGVLSSILRAVETHLQLSRNELLQLLLA